MNLHFPDFSADPSTLRVTLDVESPLLRVRLEGEIDFACADLLDTVATLELDAVETVVVQLDGLEFLDSAGLRALLRLRSQQLEAGRAVQIEGIRPNVRRVFTILGFEDALAA